MTGSTVRKAYRLRADHSLVVTNLVALKNNHEEGECHSDQSQNRSYPDCQRARDIPEVGWEEKDIDDECKHPDHRN